MNDPHVEELIYRVDPGDSTKYEGTREFKRPGFRVKIENDLARFEMEDHYATEHEARAAVQPRIDQWEFEESLKIGSGQFALRFMRSVVIDPQPDPPVPGIKSVSARFDGAPGTITAAVTVVTVSKQYPPPPSEDLMDINNYRVKRMFDQYKAYRNGRDLPVVAYICCEEFAKLGADLKDAAAKHKISHNLVKEVCKIANTKGGDGSRHAQGIGHPLARHEKQILEKAVAAMIIRAAKVAADPNQYMPEINLGNLLEISP